MNCKMLLNTNLKNPSPLQYEIFMVILPVLIELGYESAE
jgi:hypothetical protein